MLRMQVAKPLSSQLSLLEMTQLYAAVVTKHMCKTAHGRGNIGEGVRRETRDETSDSSSVPVAHWFIVCQH